jgi:hypothetical protein
MKVTHTLTKVFAGVLLSGGLSLFAAGSVVAGKTNDCQVVTSGLGCLSLAESSDGKTLAGRAAPTQDAADAAAVDGAG